MENLIFAHMIPVTEAINIIKENTPLLSPVSFPLAEASGLVLAEDVVAGIDTPPFNQSAMDGYAFRLSDLRKMKQLTVAASIAAGELTMPVVPIGQAVRIFTGAPVPNGLDTVVIQEKIVRNDDTITILDDELKEFSNIRLRGSEIRAGEIAMPAGSVLTPGAVGFLASIGRAAVMAYPRPMVRVIVTGNELAKTGEPLQPGQVYESNSILLLAALKQLRVVSVSIDRVADDPHQTRAIISHALNNSNLVLVTGGVSAGDYDFVVGAVESVGVRRLFHKVKQRPGKPLYAGIKEEKMLFGLPGNPASVLTCFYQYVIPAIESMTGRTDLLQKRNLPLATSIHKKIQLTQFLKAICTANEVTPLPAQESYRLSSFALANCLIILPEEKMEFAKGDLVETLVLPYL